MSKQRAEQILEVVTKIFYLPATNGKAQESIQTGVSLVTELLHQYASQSSKENPKVGTMFLQQAAEDNAKKHYHDLSPYQAMVFGFIAGYKEDRELAASPSPGWIKASDDLISKQQAMDALGQFYDIGEALGYSNSELSRISSCINKVRNIQPFSESPAKPEGEGLQWIKASDLKEKDPNREYIGKWRRGHVNNGRFSADGSSFLFDKYGQVDYMYYDHLFILVTGAAAHSPAGLTDTEGANGPGC